MDRKEQLSELIWYCHLIHEKGLVSSSGGNVSIRIGEDIYITPSGRSLQLIEEKDIVKLNLQGNYRMWGDVKPSKEWRMHLACYQFKEIQAVIHVHSPNSVALSCLKVLNFQCAMPIYTAGCATRVGELPVIPYYPSGSRELAEAVSKVIAWRDSVLLENHGVLAVGKNLEQALNITEEIEENARVHFILDNRGKALSGDQLTRCSMGQSRQPYGKDLR